MVDDDGDPIPGPQKHDLDCKCPGCQSRGGPSNLCPRCNNPWDNHRLMVTAPCPDNFNSIRR